MKEKEQGYSKPPQPPEVERKFQFHRLQLVGIPLILVIPILALIGVFGESNDSVNASSSQLLIEVEYPTRFRYKMITPIHVSVQNSSAQPLSTVRINFDRAFVDSFSNVKFSPSVTFITEEAYVLELTDLQPQENQVISVEIQAEEYWQHQGTVTAVPDNVESVTVSLSTLVFP